MSKQKTRARRRSRQTFRRRCVCPAISQFKLRRRFCGRAFDAHIAGKARRARRLWWKAIDADDVEIARGLA